MIRKYGWSSRIIAHPRSHNNRSCLLSELSIWAKGKLNLVLMPWRNIWRRTLRSTLRQLSFWRMEMCCLGLSRREVINSSSFHLMLPNCRIIPLTYLRVLGLFSVQAKKNLNRFNLKDLMKSLTSWKNILKTKTKSRNNLKWNNKNSLMQRGRLKEKIELL